MQNTNFSGSISDLLPINLTTAGVKHVQEARQRPKGAHFHHIFYVEKGEGLFKTPEKTMIIKEGTALFIRKNCPISYTKNCDIFQTAWATFEGAYAESILTYFDAGDLEILQSKNIYPLISECQKQMQRGASPAQLSALVYHLIITFFTELRRKDQSPALLLAKRYIEDNYSSDMSVSDVSSATGISSSLLFRLFHNEEHMTPVEYIRSIRIKKAQMLLISTPKMKISDIATACGFADVAYFCKVFREQTGITPKVYQNRFSI